MTDRLRLDELVARYQENRTTIDADEQADAQAAVLAAARRTRLESWTDRMCPARFHGVELGWTGEQHGPAVLAELCGWKARDPRTNLLLLGPVGTGKTGTALAAVRDDWITHGRAVQFWPVVDLLRGLRPDGELDMGRLTSVPLLILDDLGAEKPSDWTAEQLYALVNRRWLDQRATIATSNLPGTRATAPSGYTGDVLDEVIGERLFSRLVGDDAVVVRLSGRDRRRAPRPNQGALTP